MCWFCNKLVNKIMNTTDRTRSNVLLSVYARTLRTVKTQKNTSTLNVGKSLELTLHFPVKKKKNARNRDKRCAGDISISAVHGSACVHGKGNRMFKR